VPPARNGGLRGDLLPSAARCESPGTAVLNRWTRPLLLLILAVSLTACRRDPAPVEGAPLEPVAAVEALAAALHDGDLRRYADLSLPPPMRAQQAALWRRQMAVAPPIAAEQVQRYNELMALLTAPDAEARLWAQAEPRLAAIQQQVGPRWSMGVTMMSGFAKTAIAADPTLSAAEQSHAAGVVDAVAAWAGDPAVLTDPARGKAAIGIAVRTARELDLPTLEAARALEHDAMLDKAGVAFRGAKAIAAAFGVDVQAALSQVQAEVVEIDPAGDRAVVRVRYPLLGQQVEFQQPMVRIDGGWYREDAIDALNAALAAEAEAAPAPGAATAAR